MGEGIGEVLPVAVDALGPAQAIGAKLVGRAIGGFTA